MRKIDPSQELEYSTSIPSNATFFDLIHWFRYGGTQIDSTRGNAQRDNVQLGKMYDEILQVADSNRHRVVKRIERKWQRLLTAWRNKPLLNMSESELYFFEKYGNRVKKGDTAIPEAFFNEYLVELEYQIRSKNHLMYGLSAFIRQETFDYFRQPEIAERVKASFVWHGTVFEREGAVMIEITRPSLATMGKFLFFLPHDIYLTDTGKRKNAHFLSQSVFLRRGVHLLESENGVQFSRINRKKNEHGIGGSTLANHETIFCDRLFINMVYFLRQHAPELAAREPLYAPCTSKKATLKNGTNYLFCPQNRLVGVDWFSPCENHDSLIERWRWYATQHSIASKRCQMINSWLDNMFKKHIHQKVLTQDARKLYATMLAQSAPFNANVSSFKWGFGHVNRFNFVYRLQTDSNPYLLNYAYAFRGVLLAWNNEINQSRHRRKSIHFFNLGLIHHFIENFSSSDVFESWRTLLDSTLHEQQVCLQRFFSALNATKNVQNSEKLYQCTAWIDSFGYRIPPLIRALQPSFSSASGSENMRDDVRPFDALMNFFQDQYRNRTPLFLSLSESPDIEHDLHINNFILLLRLLIRLPEKQAIDFLITLMPLLTESKEQKVWANNSHTVSPRLVAFLKNFEIYGVNLKWFDIPLLGSLNKEQMPRSRAEFLYWQEVYSCTGSYKLSEIEKIALPSNLEQDYKQNSKRLHTHAQAMRDISIRLTGRNDQDGYLENLKESRLIKMRNARSDFFDFLKTTGHLSYKKTVSLYALLRDDVTWHAHLNDFNRESERFYEKLFFEKNGFYSDATTLSIKIPPVLLDGQIKNDADEYKLPIDSDAAIYVRQLISDDDCVRESELLGHCVGTHGYWYEILNKRSLIFTLSHFSDFRCCVITEKNRRYLSRSTVEICFQAIESEYNQMEYRLNFYINQINGAVDFRRQYPDSHQKAAEHIINVLNKAYGSGDGAVNFRLFLDTYPENDPKMESEFKQFKRNTPLPASFFWDFGKRLGIKTWELLE